MDEFAVPDLWTGSDYYLLLDSGNKVTYKEKLTLTDGAVLPDPFTLENWSDDICLLPQITYPDIYTYLIIYTQSVYKGIVEGI